MASTCGSYYHHYGRHWPRHWIPSEEQNRALTELRTVAGNEKCKIFHSYLDSSHSRQLIWLHKENPEPMMAATLSPLAVRLYPCTRVASSRSTQCGQAGQVRDQGLSFRFRGAVLTVVLSFAVTALKDNKNCFSNCGRLYNCSGDSLPIPGSVFMADLAT